jgi:uncharacterized surface protein with fasciclin (FAS1) repeats
MPNIVSVAQKNGSFTTLVKALEDTDLVAALSGEGPFTVFAPTDEAFADIDSDLLQKLLKDKDKLTEVLKYHVAAGLYTSTDLEGTARLTTLEGDDLTVDSSNGIRVDEATVRKADIEADNGIIHVVDQVILPERFLY